jgi:hypothetical protein
VRAVSAARTIEVKIGKEKQPPPRTAKYRRWDWYWDWRREHRERERERERTEKKSWCAGPLTWCKCWLGVKGNSCSRKAEVAGNKAAGIVWVSWVRRVGGADLSARSLTLSRYETTSSSLRSLVPR